MFFDLHVHSIYSDGANTPAEIIKYAQSIGLSGIALTDHNEVAGAREALKVCPEGFKIISGVEVSSLSGHILGLGITEKISIGLSAGETIARIHAAGGIAIAAHPFDRLRQGVGDSIYTLDYDAVEVYNGHTIMMSRSVDEILEGLRLPVTGGSDAHMLSELGSVVMELPGDPIEAIVSGGGRISVNISKTKILLNHFKRRLAKKSEVKEVER